MIRSVLISLLLALAVAAWIFSGTFGADPRADAANTPTAENASLKIEPVLVRTRSMTAEHHVRDVVLRGRTEAKRWVDVQAETGGRLVSILVQKGDSVREGQVLVRIDMDDREARLAEALARVNQRQLEYDAAEQLNERGYRSDTKLAAAAAELDRAIASQTQVEIDIANTEIRAPFAGRVEERNAELGYVVGAGSTVARIVDQDPYLLV
ncbi:MAG TPA: efflux RND transporter periplasmic adaptor subunit, partial [Alphaproteobacteria bacterium]|nr:efflux RND transporter periplasmic adaptor subunit [Alphaproteobacteria bacterium]